MGAHERQLRAELPKGETRQRLIAAALEEFAQRGFASARVRHIVDQARANLAAVNYHFGGKEGLYRATLAHLAERRPSARTTTQRRGRSPQQRLERRVYALLERFLVNTQGAALGRILAHEAMNPTAHLEDVIAESLRPELAEIRQLLAAIVPDASEESVAHAAVGVLGQCLLYQFAQPALARVHPHMPRGRTLCRTVSLHVTSLTVAGLRGLANGLQPSRESAARLQV